jgi:hypothetical protein
MELMVMVSITALEWRNAEVILHFMTDHLRAQLFASNVLVDAKDIFYKDLPARELTVDEKHRIGLCTVIGCEDKGESRVTAKMNGLFFIECLCKTHYAIYKGVDGNG